MDDWRERIAACGDEQLSAALVASIEELFARDAHLLDVNVHENAIAAVLRGYMLPKVGNGPDGAPWDVDFDYNRDHAVVKRVNGAQAVRPDLIVHRRNTNVNRLAVEMKKGGSPEPDWDDMASLAAYRRPPEAQGLGYQYALFLRFGVGENAGQVACVQWV